MLGCNLSNFHVVVILELVNVANNFTLICPNSSQEKQVLQILVLAEWRWFDDDLLQQLNELDREVSSQEGLDSYRYVVGIGRLR